MSQALEMAAALLRQHEGFSAIAYLDSEEVYTIGFGHNMESTPITNLAGNVILYDDIEQSIHFLTKALPNFDIFSTVRQSVLIDMMFNLGPGSFDTFLKFKEALKYSNFDIASEEMIDSKWHEQLPNRVTHLAEMLRLNEYLVLCQEPEDPIDDETQFEPEDPDEYLKKA